MGTEETASTARIYRAMDIESGALGIIIGGRKFRMTGRNVYVSREGESLKLMDAKGRLFDIAYDKVESPQRVEGHLVEPPIESGTCKLILTTYGGDESEDAKLGIYERVVSFVKFDEPVPVIEYVESELGKNRIAESIPVSVHGQRLGDARKLTLKYTSTYGGESETDWTAVMPSEDGMTIELESVAGLPANIDASKPVTVCLRGEEYEDIVAEIGGVTWVE